MTASQFGLSTTVIDKIHGVLAQHPHVQRAVLYGSRAKGNYKPGSDIDLTLFATEGQDISHHELADILDEVDDLLLPYTLDLSVFEHLNHDKLREHIERVGKVFYERPGAAMKAGWRSKPMADVCQIKPPKAEARKRLSGKELVSFVPMEDLGIDQKILVPRQSRTLDEVAGSYTYFADGDVLLAKITPCFENGKLGIADNLTNGIGFGSSEYIVLRPSPAVDKEWLYYFLSRQSFRTEGAERMSGAVGHKRVSKEFVESYPIPVPPLPEQHRIVAILDQAFDGIATAKANAEKNLQNARALFESHLQSVFTERGEGWEQKTLEEIATTFGRGKSRHRPRNAKHLYGGQYPFIQTGDIRNADHVITEYSQTYSEAGLAQSKLWPKGTICITIAANIAETAILGFEACFPDSVIGIVADPKEADVDFIEYLLQSFKARIQSMGKGSAQANINMGTFENERFPFPSAAEQKTIVAKLDALSEETQRLESLYQQKLTALDELKKSLLHQAFSGQL